MEKKKSKKKMTEEELKILENINGKRLELDVSKKYSDEFYDEYVSKFLPNKKKKIVYKTIKRLFDFIVSLICIIILAIPFIIISIAIKCDSKGPVIFKNRRVGKNKKIFKCWKFRSMSVEAPSEVSTQSKQAESYVTKVGKFIRKTSIDELAQLFNVFTGKMSIIGYRPILPTEIKCNDLRESLGVFKMKPGISGYAQVHGRDDVYYKNKAIMDAYYVKYSSIWFDLKLMFQTVGVVLKGKDNWDK